MRKSTVQTSSGLLPDEIYELTLEPCDEAGWRVWVGYRGDREDKAIEFGGGTDPQAWLALKLASEHGFEEVSAAQVASRLFSGFVRSPPPNEHPPQLHGTPADL